MAIRPRTIPELIQFYYDQFKPLYSHVQLLNTPPVEIFFELNAAFDHLSRHWQFGEPEDKCVSSAAAHLKRGCFDAFKIILRETRSQYERLLTTDLSVIDNGEFEREMVALFAEIKREAIDARAREGDSRGVGPQMEEQWNTAFDLWEGVYAKCVRLEQEFFLCPKVEWARRKQRRQTLRVFGYGVLASVVATLICLPFTCLWPNAKLMPGNMQDSPKPAEVSKPMSEAEGQRPTLMGAANSAEPQQPYSQPHN